MRSPFVDDREIIDANVQDFEGDSNLSDEETDSFGPSDRLPRSADLLPREEDDPDAADQVLKWHVANLVKHSAVSGIVEVITQHEVVTRRNCKDFRVVKEAVVVQVEHRVARPIRQGFAPAFGPRALSVLVGPDEVFHPLMLDWRAIDVQDAIDHLDAVVRKTHEPLDIVGRRIPRKPEDHDIAPLRL